MRPGISGRRLATVSLISSINDHYRTFDNFYSIFTIK